ncbi:MAG: hypothetical protein GFH27_549409n36 [Chloroflexi bacterium AL-W]|nr:hypothetical protein [Chloroflexi bacterium AL-N1]NOK71371.1 hypothetical protein [Chloroflexi bacterium AL-N10]NOK78774.1 hypothetical protein [Chloroflexi bacterium AL-N5]NOK86144.1 hypothetical protein [Chloroflexi bacterium AL-W]NOK93097.1 hypothetical protein [Chloroflexi bacterium AL-N15]
MTDHTDAGYENIALKYAQKVDSKPIHMYYEHPALVLLLPSLAHTNVLDVMICPLVMHYLPDW